MAAGAPKKLGLDYITFDVRFFDDQRYLLLEDEIPDRGFKVYLYFKAFIARTSSYIKWDDATRVQFYKAFNLTKEETKRILDVLIAVGLFDADLFKVHRVITSLEIQDHYIQATHRRQESIFIKEYTLIDIEKYKRNQHVILKDKAGVILRDFSKQKKRTQTKPEKSKPSATQKTPILPPANSTHVTHQDIKNFLVIPYNEREEIFRKKWTEQWYKSFITYNSTIDKDYSSLRNSNFQMTIAEYKILIDKLKPSEQEFSAALQRLAAYGIKPEQSVRLRMEDAISWIRNPNRTVNNQLIRMPGAPLAPRIPKNILFDGTKGATKK
jgi:hypothetical protein